MWSLVHDSWSLTFENDFVLIAWENTGDLQSERVILTSLPVVVGRLG